MEGYLTEEEIPIYCTSVDGVTMTEVVIASDLIDGYLGRTFKPTEFSERIRLDRRRRGKLKHSPIIDVKKAISKTGNLFGNIDEELNVLDIDLDPENDGYFTYLGRGGIFSVVYTDLPKRPMPMILEMTYIAGYDPYPSLLKTATAMLAQNIVQAQGFAGAKKLTSLDFSVEMTNDSFFTSDIKNLLRSLV